MRTLNKVRTGAALVAINGLAALTLLSTPALAQSCPSRQLCVLINECFSDPAPTCNSYAPPGCTFSASQCGGICSNLPPVPRHILTCHYS